MPKISNLELTQIVEGQHVGIVLLMPGSTLRCPGKAIVVQEQTVQFAIAGCEKCAVHAIRGVLQNNQQFARLLLQALDPNFNI